MALKRPTWLSGRVVTLEYTSKVLLGNPLGDPHVRTLDVWLPPQYDAAKGRGLGKRFPVLFDLVGFTGSGRAHTAWRNFDENVPERAARLVHEGKMAPAIIVFPDCFTAFGGNQYVNSPAIGRYADYLTRELVPFVDRELRTLAAREHRGVFGKSSGGYGALVHAMKYTKYWGAAASHSGDAGFETLLFHELRVANMVQSRHRPLGYYKTAAGVEIDFVIEKRRRRANTKPRVILIEAKLANRWDRAWDRPMRELAKTPGIEVEACFGVYTGTRSYRFDEVEVLPVTDFLTRLHAGEIL